MDDTAHTPRQRVTTGDTVNLKLPCTEVCLHLRVADQVRPVRVLEHGLAQILNEDGSPFSFPILHGEAGIHTDHEGRLSCHTVMPARGA